MTTAGGILGKVRKVKQTTFLLEIASGVTIEIDKNSVYPSAPQPGDNPDSQKLEPGK